MPWARIDDGFDDHKKVVALLDEDEAGAGAIAVGLWTLCLTWAHRNTRKRGQVAGLLPAGLPRRFLGSLGKDAAQLLVKHGLWEPQDDGGWRIHDFDDYLPTETTREARSAAGKRGAASRWAKKPEDSMANSHSSDGKLPSTSHDAASKPVASDGSRAPARRAIPKGIAPTPEPIPGVEPDGSTPPPVGAAKSRRGKRVAEDDPIVEANSKVIVAAYVDGSRAAKRARPAEELLRRVGRTAKRLLVEGKPLDELVAAAKAMGENAWVDLALQHQKMSGPNGSRGSPKTDGRKVSTESELDDWEAGREVVP